MAEIKIQIEGYEGIDEEKSNFAEGIIVLKKKEVTPWRVGAHILTGYRVNTNSLIISIHKSDNYFTDDVNRNIFATIKQAKSMLAMAQISQIIANDKRFGGPFTDKEWLDCNIPKHVIDRYNNDIKTYCWVNCAFRFLTFHTAKQRDLFLKENEDLIRQYFMLD